MTSASVSFLRSLLAVCLCGIATIAGACGDGSPTGPSANQPLPFRGSLEAIDVDTITFPILTVHLAGGGTATEIGTYKAVFDFKANLQTPEVPAAGTFTLTASNGDTIVGSLSGRAQIADGIATVTESMTITGGTGRFAGATGTFTVQRTAVQATGATSGSFDGTITLRN
jgi:hypothetical protein